MGTTLTTDAEMLEKIEAFCERTGLKPTSFGRLAIGDGNLVPNLKANRSLTLKTARRVLDFIATYKPTSEQAAA